MEDLKLKSKILLFHQYQKESVEKIAELHKAH